jgi:hypothetical protein
MIRMDDGSKEKTWNDLMQDFKNEGKELTWEDLAEFQKNNGIVIH